MSRFDGTNQSGVFHINYQHHHHYYLTQETKQATYPCPLNRVWKESVLEIAANALVIPLTRARRPQILSIRQCSQQVLASRPMPVKMNRNPTISGSDWTLLLALLILVCKSWGIPIIHIEGLHWYLWQQQQQYWYNCNWESTGGREALNHWAPGRSWEWR